MKPPSFTSEMYVIAVQMITLNLWGQYVNTPEPPQITKDLGGICVDLVYNADVINFLGALLKQLSRSNFVAAALLQAAFSKQLC